MKQNVLISISMACTLFQGVMCAMVTDGDIRSPEESLEVSLLKKDITEAILKNDKKRVERVLSSPTIPFFKERDFDELIGEAQKLVRLKEATRHSFWNWLLMVGGAALVVKMGYPMLQRRTRSLEDEINKETLAEMHASRQQDLARAKERTARVAEMWKNLQEKKAVAASKAPQGIDGQVIEVVVQSKIDDVMAQLPAMFGLSEDSLRETFQSAEVVAQQRFDFSSEIVNDSTKKQQYLEEQRWSWVEWSFSSLLLATGNYVIFRGWWPPYGQRAQARDILQMLRTTKMAVVKPVTKETVQPVD